MSADADPPSPHKSPGKRRHQTDRPSFRSARKSFIPEELVKQLEAERLDKERLSLRRRSRSYSKEVNPRDILNPKTRIILQWKDLTFKVQPSRPLIDAIRRRPKPDQITIISNLSGSLKPGEVLGVMGPSGCGKSFFLNTLSGRLPKGQISGQILANGWPVDKSWRHVVSVVEQDTAYLDPRLTVIELIKYTADLAVPEKYSEEEKQTRINHVLKMMDILHISDSTIGGEGVKGISGGERKRLAIALELLQEPKVILLDEPTSGLDSKTAADLVKYLYQLAVIDDLIIIMTIHQPRISVLTKFHKLLIMHGGSMVCFGTIDDVLLHFESCGFHCPPEENPADFFLQVMQTESAEDGEGNVLSTAEKLKRTWREGKLKEALDILPVDDRTEHGQKLTEAEKNLGRYKEFVIISKRYWKSLIRDKEYQVSTNIMLILPALLSFAVFFQIPDDGFAAIQNRLGLISYLPCDSNAISIITSLLFSAIYAVKREQRRNLARSSSYYSALIMIQFPIWLITMSVISIAQYYISGFRYTPFTAMLIFVAYYLAIALQGLGIGMVFASITSNLQVALTLGTFYELISVLFNGLTVNTNNISWVIRWIRYVSPLFYLNTGLAQNEFDGQVLNGQPGEFWLGIFALDTVSILWTAGALLVITAASLIAGGYMFYRRTRPVVRLPEKIL